jgi:hypothetical protein
VPRAKAADHVEEAVEMSEAELEELPEETQKRGAAKGILLAGGVGLVMLTALMVKRRKRSREEQVEDLLDTAESNMESAAEEVRDNGEDIVAPITEGD